MFPDQIVDEITGMIYPPSSAIIPQLATIRSIATSTIKVYDATNDIHSIFPNLNTMQEIINYLRGAPPLEFPEPEPEEPEDIGDFAIDGGEDNKDKIHFTESTFDDTIAIMILGKQLIQENTQPDLFGETLPKNTIIAKVKFNAKEGNKYHIQQMNPALANYPDDPYVTGEPWIKKKDYVADMDTFEYYFLIPDGENKITIQVYDLEADKMLKNYVIYSNISFKEEEFNG